MCVGEKTVIFYHTFPYQALVCFWETPTWEDTAVAELARAQ